MNLFYEFSAACTSIVAQQQNGTILHGRNLDYEIPYLQNTTINVNFLSNNATVAYRGVTFCGYVGLLTGLRPGAFSISIDERLNGSIFENFLSALLDHGKPIGFTIRDTLATQTTYAAALDVLQTQDLVAAVYIIVGGVNPNEGAIITRNRETTYNLWPMEFPSRWYILVTNYDLDVPPPKNDNRSGPANAMMEKSNPQNISLDYMFGVLSTFPVLNSNTMYTTMMSAALDVLYTVTRNNP